MDGEPEPSSQAPSYSTPSSSFSIGQICLAFAVAMIASAAIHSTLFTDETSGQANLLGVQANLHGEGVTSSNHIQKLLRIYERKLKTGYRRISSLWTATSSGSEQNACSGIESRADCRKVAGNSTAFPTDAITHWHIFTKNKTYNFDTKFSNFILPWLLLLCWLLL
jgi:hypothetical protein